MLSQLCQFTMTMSIEFINTNKNFVGWNIHGLECTIEFERGKIYFKFKCPTKQKLHFSMLQIQTIRICICIQYSVVFQREIL